MASGEDWLFRPVGRGCYRMESLLDGSLSLADVADVNEYLDVLDENDWRLRKATETE